LTKNSEIPKQEPKMSEKENTTAVEQVPTKIVGKESAPHIMRV
jgi:hypothetical protein